MIVTAGKVDISVYYYIVGDASNAAPGEPVTGLLFSDIETGGSASYARQGAARVDLTLITLASASAAHDPGGFILVDDTEMPGLYRCDYPDAAFAAGVDEVALQIRIASGKNAVAAPIKVQLTVMDLRDGVRAGLTALPNAAADGAFGLPISDAGGLDLDDIPITAEFEARTLVAAAYFDPAVDAVADVTLVATTTTNTDMVGTDGAALASVVGALADAAAVGDPTAADTLMQYVKQLINLIAGSTGIGTMPAGLDPADGINLFEMLRAAMGGTFATATDSLEAVRDRGDAAWITGATAPTAAVVADAVWDEILTGASHNIATSAGRRLRQIEEAFVHANGVIAAVGGGDTYTLDAGAVGTADYYVGDRLQITEGTGAGQSRVITAYTAGRVVTLATAFTINPDTFSLYEVDAADVHVAVSDDKTGYAIAVGGIAATAFAAGAINAAATSTDFVDEIWDKICEDQANITAQETMSIVLAACAGVTAGSVFKSPNGVSTRITATLVAEERTVIVLAPSAGA